MIVWGLLLGVVGAALAEFKKNGGLIPLNKNLWWVAYCAFVLYIHIRMLPWSIELDVFKLCVRWKWELLLLLVGAKEV